MRTLQDTLTYGSGLAVATWLPIALCRGDESVPALAYVPRRGFPRITVSRGGFTVVCYRVRGNDLEELSRSTTAYGFAEFNEKTRNPACSVKA